MIPHCGRLASVVLLVGLPVFAGRPKVLLVPLASGEGVSEKVAERLETLLADELRGRGELEVVEFRTVAVTAETGKRALEEHRFEDAAVAFRHGLEILGAEPGVGDLGQLTQASLGLATALFRLGEEREAKETLVALACVAPNLRLPVGYPPVFHRELDRAKKRALRRAKGQLSVDGPKDARVWVDGRELGRVPVLIDWPLVGRHLVRVEGPAAGEHFAQLVDVKSGLAKVHASFGARGLVLDETDLRRLWTLTGAADAPYALVGAVTRSSGTQLAAGLALYARDLNVVSELEPVALEADEALARPQVRSAALEVARRVSSFGPPATLPLNLAARPRPSAPSPRPAAPALVPQAALEKPLAPTGASLSEPPPVKVEPPKGPPTWVYIVGGIAVAAGLGVGGYFGISALNRPVTGTVSASW